MAFDDLNEVPAWVKTIGGVLLSAGAVKLLAVWFEHRRLASKDYRDTLLGRIRDLEEKIEEMYDEHVVTSAQVATLTEANRELRADLDECKRLHAQQRRPPRRS